MKFRTNNSLPNAVVLIPERTLEAKADDDEEVEVDDEEDAAADEDDDDAAAEVAVLASPTSSRCSLSTVWIVENGLLLLLQENGEELLLRRGRGAEGRCRPNAPAAAMADGLDVVDVDRIEAAGIMLLLAADASDRMSELSREGSEWPGRRL